MYRIYPNYLDREARETGYLVVFSPGPSCQQFFSLTSSLMTNSLTVVAKVFSDTLIFLLQKCEKLLHFSAKDVNVFAISQERNNVPLANNFVKFLTTGFMNSSFSTRMVRN